MNSPKNTLNQIDVNSPDFYNNLQDEIEIDLARLKKGVDVVRKLRRMYLPTSTYNFYHKMRYRASLISFKFFMILTCIDKFNL